MGRYINWDDVALRYPSVSNIGGATEIGSAYIGYVEAQVDGLLAPKYTVPFSSNVQTVKDICIELVYARSSNLKIEEANSLKEDVMNRIDRIKSGAEAILTNSGDVVHMSGEVIWSSTEGYNPVFGMLQTENMEVDSSQVYDELQDRGY